MLSEKEIVCPNNLLNVAHKKKGVTVGIVNAGKPLPMLSVMDAVNKNLIIPVLIGDKDILSAAGASWYKNNGSESFTKYDIGGGDYGIYSIDLDRDGDLDILNSEINSEIIR